MLLLSTTGCFSPYAFSGRPEVMDNRTLPAITPKIIISDNQVYENNRSGIRIRGDSPVLIQNCEVSRNGRAGLLIENSARATITGNNFSGNNMAGIAGNNCLLLKIRENRLHQNKEGGGRFRSDTSAGRPMLLQLDRNRIFRNKLGGLHIVSTALPPIEATLSNNKVYRNGQAGVRIEDNVHLTGFHNWIDHNETAGFASYITEETAPMFDLYQNRISFNRGAGVFVQSGITGRIGISDNLVYNNTRAGIAAGLWGEGGSDRIDLEIYHNTVVSNGSKVEGAGIRNGNRGPVDIRNNILAYNFTSGIMSKGCGGASSNLLFANGETSTINDTSRDLFFLTERLQYSGCNVSAWRDVLAPPLFTAPDRYDFSLQQDSPARNAAVDLDSDYFRTVPHPDLGANILLLPWISPEARP